MKSNFHILFKTYQDKMIMQQEMTAKNIANEKIDKKKEVCEFEQKPIANFNEFTDAKENDIKKQAEKRTAIRRERSEEMKGKKRKIKAEETKAKEGQMWQRLAELNGEFKKIKDSKKDAKKAYKTVSEIVVNRYFNNFIL